MKFNSITIQVLWNRLITIVDEAAGGLIRTAYTPSVKEYHDFCCALFDRNARMLSHSTITTAGFLGVVPGVMKQFILKYPPEKLDEGDVLITNDPWLASGHLIDVSVAQPIYYLGEIVGYALCIVHHLDMGGRMATLESKDMYEEGLKIPILKLYREGNLDPTIYAFMNANLRVPEKVLGDIRAQLVANHVCTRGLLALLEEYQMSGLEDLAQIIIERTELSLRRKISALPDGIHHCTALLPPIPSCPDRVELKAKIEINGDGVIVDWTGSSGEVAAAINGTPNILQSFTTYPFKLALDPNVPNNEGGLNPITVIAPEGCILNSRPPAATWGRTMIYHVIPEILFSALENVMPENVLGGNGGTPANEVYLHGWFNDGRSFMAIQQHSGGFGASVKFDGYSCLPFPNNTANIPVEVTENESTIVYLKKEFVQDSGGPGEMRGGLGQVVEFKVPDYVSEIIPNFIECSVRVSGRHMENCLPVSGRFGGKPGNSGGLWLNDKPVDHGIYRRIFPGDRIRFALYGGGGYGDPLKRLPEKVISDIKEGYVSNESGEIDYGVVLCEDKFEVDAEATNSLRKEIIRTRLKTMDS